MLNVFHRDGETIRHFWGSERFYAQWDPGQDPRRVGLLEPLWNISISPRRDDQLGRATELRLSTALLIALAAACWAVMANRMQGMDMGPGTDLGSLGWFAGVWLTMMAAMMLPSLAPRATVPFAAGFLVPWLAAGVVGYGLVQGVRLLDLSFLGWDEGGRYVAGAVILGAALYELTPAKRSASGTAARPGGPKPASRGSSGRGWWRAPTARAAAGR
jgi:Predicted metal-binding integral membrane protein (DUF2182)